MGTGNRRKAARGRLLLALNIVTVNLLAAGVSLGADLRLDAWGSPDLGDWDEKSFEGNTRYRGVQEGQDSILTARANSEASALFLKRKIDVDKTPLLNWKWRVLQFNGAKDHLRKEEDDFPARLYVVVREGFLPWQTLAINYVWAEGQTGKNDWPNPFTSKAIMVPLVEGVDGIGEWRQEQVNVVADFKRLFGKDISTIDGVAVMTDADNFGGISAADYGPIWFSSQ